MKDIFISYSANDSKMTDIIRRGHLENYPTWAMSDGSVGENYIDKIKEKLNDCGSAILILSPSFFQSEFIMNEELPALLERNKDPEFKLLPILLSECKLEDIDKLGTINIFPSRSQPMNRFVNQDFNHYMSRFKNENLDNISSYSKGLKNISWQELQTQFKQDVPVTNPMRGTRGLMLIAGPKNKLELFIPTNGEEADIELNIRAISTRKENAGAEEFFVLSMENEKLLEFFFTFCCYIDDEFSTSSKGLAVNIKNVTKRWKELTREERSMRDIEKGLLGELWFLSNLIDSFGQEIIKDWRGSDGDRHDFRIQNQEFEVKTTASNNRVHYISSINQLEASLECDLTLISLQVAPTKSGKKTISVKKQIDQIEGKLKSEDYLSLFHLKLKEYINDDLSAVTKMKTNYIFSSEPMFMIVDDTFPRISNDEFLNLNHYERITDVKYRLNVEGLGESCDGINFQKVIKRINI